MPTTVTRATTRPTPAPPADLLDAARRRVRWANECGFWGVTRDVEALAAEVGRLRAEVERLRAELARLAEYCAYLGDSGHVSPGRTVELSARVRDAWAVLGEGGGGQGG